MKYLLILSGISFFSALFINRCSDGKSETISNFQDNSNEWGYRKALPKNATGIKEYKWADGFLPDYEYYLKAKISRRDFIQYCDTFSLTFNTETRTYSDEMTNLSTYGGNLKNVKEWWNTDSGLDSLYVWQEGHEWNIARYVGGYLYLYAHEH